MVVLILLGLALAGLLLPASAGARTFSGFHQIITDAPVRASIHLGNIPLEIVTPSSRTVTLRAGRDRYRGQWNNIAIQASTTSFLLKVQRAEIRRGGGDRTLTFADRQLTATERKDFKLLLDIGRDADVLVVARDHPACAGLTTAQVRQIASGAIKRWSQVVPLTEGQPDTIALHHTIYQRGFEARFGVTKLPASAKGSAFGGIVEAARGDRAVAGVTSWARYRRSGGGCAVPLDGVAPTNERVHALTYPGAYPLGIVAHRRRQRGAHDRVVRKAYLAHLRSERASEKFKENGMLLAKEPPPAERPESSPPSSSPPASSGGPTQDYRGRPITPVRDDAGGRSTLTGERLQQSQDGRLDERFAFDPDRVLRHIQRAPDGSTCSQVTGTWDVEAAWHYDEHGGGLIARVRLQDETARTVTLELPNDSPSVAYLDGRPLTRSRELSGGCR